MRNRVILTLSMVVSLAAFPVIAAHDGRANTDQSRRFSKELPKDQKIVQALNRLTFGPRPGNAQRVKSMGLKRWIDLQLHPERIAENPVLHAKLRTFDTLDMPVPEMIRNYPTPQMVRQMVQGQVAFPPDPDRQRMIRKLVARAERKEGAGANSESEEIPAV